MAKLIAINEHPNNLDKEARLVAEDRAGRWSVYSVKGGYVAIINHKAVEGLFKTEREARDIIEDLSPQGASSLAETFAA